MGDDQRQRVVAASCRVRPHHEAHAHAHKKRAHQRRQQRQMAHIRQHVAHALKHGVAGRVAQRRRQRARKERPAQQRQPQRVKDHVQHNLRHRGGNAEEVLHQQRHAQDAALGDGALAVHIVVPKGHDHRAQQHGRIRLYDPFHTIFPFFQCPLR